MKNPAQEAGFFWRRRRDSNPRTAFDGYTISSRAPSTKLGDSSVCRSADAEGLYSVQSGWQLDEAEHKTAQSNCRTEGKTPGGNPTKRLYIIAPLLTSVFRGENAEFCRVPTS